MNERSHAAVLSLPLSPCLSLSHTHTHSLSFLFQAVDPQLLSPQLIHPLGVRRLSPPLEPNHMRPMSQQRGG